MSRIKNSYPGKILLFGEYSILAGSNAAVIPYRNVSASLIQGSAGEGSNRMLSSFAGFLKSSNMFHEYIHVELMARDVHKGLTFQSTIPQNKGLGSSGAICAAIYDRYKKSELKHPAVLRQIFSDMESWFHGKSSGIDPLCIFFNRPVIIKNGEYLVVENELPLNNHSVKPFLIDTGIESQTRPLVEHFRTQLEDSVFLSDFSANYIPLVNRAVNEWENGKLGDDIVFELSRTQQEYFRKMIPHEYLNVWHEGINNELYAIKLCGSGGGGMLLGFTRKTDESALFLKKQFGINLIPV